MRCHAYPSRLAWLVLLPPLAGCMVPTTQLNACRTQKINLAERCRAQTVEIQNLKSHTRNVEDELLRAEHRLSRLRERLGLAGGQLAELNDETANLRSQYAGRGGSPAVLPAEVRRQLRELSDREESLTFDPATGLTRFDADILFDTGEAELKPEAKKTLLRLTAILSDQPAEDLRLMIVGHTDNRRIADRPVREKYPSNFHLSTARANAVAAFLQQKGIAPRRVGVAGFGAHQPLAPNGTPSDRRKNRRVEIFVMARGVPVVGWTETIPSVYR